MLRKFRIMLLGIVVWSFFLGGEGASSRYLEDGSNRFADPALKTQNISKNISAIEHGTKYIIPTVNTVQKNDLVYPEEYAQKPISEPPKQNKLHKGDSRNKNYRKNGMYRIFALS